MQKLCKLKDDIIIGQIDQRMDLILDRIYEINY